MERIDLPPHTLVVYESSFGNTKSIAEAIAFGLAGDVELMEVNDAPPALGPEVALLVVGGPTHAFTMSRASTRQNAADMAGNRPARIGIREWIAELTAPSGVLVATFDTKIDRPKLPGSAARAAARQLRRKGLGLAVPPETFSVTGTMGPLQDGERDRAHVWGARVARLAGTVLGATETLDV